MNPSPQPTTCSVIIVRRQGPRMSLKNAKTAFIAINVFGFISSMIWLGFGIWLKSLSSSVPARNDVNVSPVWLLVEGFIALVIVEGCVGIFWSLFGIYAACKGQKELFLLHGVVNTLVLIAEISVFVTLSLKWNPRITDLDLVQSVFGIGSDSGYWTTEIFIGGIPVLQIFLAFYMYRVIRKNQGTNMVP